MCGSAIFAHREATTERSPSADVVPATVCCDQVNAREPIAAPAGRLSRIWLAPEREWPNPLPAEPHVARYGWHSLRWPSTGPSGPASAGVTDWRLARQRLIAAADAARQLGLRDCSAGELVLAESQQDATWRDVLEL
jgi:hypothetical protein